MSDEIKYHILNSKNAALLDGADVFDDDVNADQLLAFIAGQAYEMVFAMSGAKVVGMASGTVLLHPDKQPAFYINEVGVNEDMRLHGIATTLTEKLKALAHAKGCVDIWLATENDNIEARALYQKLNARETQGIVVYDWGNAMDD